MKRERCDQVPLGLGHDRDLRRRRRLKPSGWGRLYRLRRRLVASKRPQGRRRPGEKPHSLDREWSRRRGQIQGRRRFRERQSRRRRDGGLIGGFKPLGAWLLCLGSCQPSDGESCRERQEHSAALGGGYATQAHACGTVVGRQPAVVRRSPRVRRASRVEDNHIRKSVGRAGCPRSSSIGSSR